MRFPVRLFARLAFAAAGSLGAALALAWVRSAPQWAHQSQQNLLSQHAGTQSNLLLSPEQRALLCLGAAAKDRSACETPGHRRRHAHLRARIAAPATAARAPRRHTAPPPPAVRAHRSTHVDTRTTALLAAYHAHHYRRALRLARQIAPILRARRDAGIAAVAAWAALNAGRLAEARQWFNRVRQWAPANTDARYGLALTQYKQGDLAEALTTLQGLADRRAEALRGDIWLARAAQRRDAHQYLASQRALARAAAAGLHNADTLDLTGWNALSLGRYDAAAQAFSAAYALRADTQAAQGWTLALARAHEHTSLQRLASGASGPLREQARHTLAQEAFDRGLFHLSESLQPRRALAGLDAPALIAVAQMRRQLERPGGAYHIEPRLAAAGVLALSPVTELGVYLRRASSPHADVTDAVLDIEHQDWGAWGLRLGALHSSLVGARPEARLGWRQQTAAGEWRIEAFDLPVRETVQSEAGEWDPVARRAWGGVNREGLGGAWRNQWSARWSTSVSAKAYAVTGRNVLTNHGAEVSLSLDANLGADLPGRWEYFTLGPAFDVLAYARNEDFPTWGQGGYFSPSLATSVGLASNWQTPQDRAWLARGNVGLGETLQAQAAAACYPVGMPTGEPLCPSHPATHNSGPYAHAAVDAIRLLGGRWAVGLSLSYTLSPNYHNAGLALFFRRTLGERSGTLSTDIPDFLTP